MGKQVLTIISVYAPQDGLSDAEKELFYDQLQCLVGKIPDSEMLIAFGHRNGHVGKLIEDFVDVHSGHGYGVRNAAGVRLLEFAMSNDLVVGDTWFTKRESNLITYASGETEHNWTTSCTGEALGEPYMTLKLFLARNMYHITDLLCVISLSKSQL